MKEDVGKMPGEKLKANGERQPKYPSRLAGRDDALDEVKKEWKPDERRKDERDLGAMDEARREPERDRAQRRSTEPRADTAKKEERKHLRQEQVQKDLRVTRCLRFDNRVQPERRVEHAAETASEMRYSASGVSVPQDHSPFTGSARGDEVERVAIENGIFDARVCDVGDLRRALPWLEVPVHPVGRQQKLPAEHLPVAETRQHRQQGEHNHGVSFHAATFYNSARTGALTRRLVPRVATFMSI